MLGHDAAAVSHQRPDRGQGLGEKPGLGVGRVEDDDPEGRRRGGLRTAQPGDGVRPDDPDPISGEVRPPEVGRDDRGRSLVTLDERRVGGAARQGLDAGRAGAREQVEHVRARQVRLEDRRTASA